MSAAHPAVVVQKYIGLAIAAEILRRSDIPCGPNIGQDGFSRRQAGTESAKSECRWSSRFLLGCRSLKGVT